MKKGIRVIITFVAVFAILGTMSYIYYINRCKELTVEQILNVELSDIDRILITKGCGVEKTITAKSEIQEVLHPFLPIKLKGINNLDKYFSTRTGGDYFYIRIHQKNTPDKNLVIYSDGVVKCFEEDKPRNYFRTNKPLDQEVIQQFTEKYHL